MVVRLFAHVCYACSILKARQSGWFYHIYFPYPVWMMRICIQNKECLWSLDIVRVSYTLKLHSHCLYINGYKRTMGQLYAPQTYCAPVSPNSTRKPADEGLDDQFSSCNKSVVSPKRKEHKPWVWFTLNASAKLLEVAKATSGKQNQRDTGLWSFQIASYMLGCVQVALSARNKRTFHSSVELRARW